MKKIRVLLIVNNFDHSSGVTTYLINLIKYMEKKYELYLITSPGTAQDLLNDYNIKYFIIKYINFEKRNFFNFMRSILTVSRILIKNKIDLVHSNDHYTANIIRYTKIVKNIPNVRTLHSWFPQDSKLNKLEGDYLICVNYNLYKDVIVKNKIQEKASVIFNGVDFENFNESYRKVNDKIVLLVASRLVYEKGVQIVISAVSELPPKYQEKIILKIAGKGDYKNELLQLCNKKNVNIKFLGEVSELSKEYRQTDIFIFSSLVDLFGYTNIEAAKYGCFVITSNFNGIEFIFEDNVDGFIYNKNSYIDLKDKIIKAIQLGEKRKDYIHTFQKKCIKLFNAKYMTEKTCKVYEKCLEKDP